MTKGDVVDCCGKLLHGPIEDGRPGTGQGYCGGGENNWASRSCGEISPVMAGRG